MVSVETNSHLPINGANIAWHVGDTTGQIFSAPKKTDNDGKYLIPLARNQIVEGKSLLYVSVAYNKEVRQMKMQLPVQESKLSIKFYPEGGNLVNRIQSCIGWEAKNEYGAPLKINAILYKDNAAVDTIQTDRYGLGKFILIPIIGSKYELKVIGEAKANSYLLPSITEKGPVITLKKAIANDSLQIRLGSKYPQKYFILIHNFRQVFYSFPVQVSAAEKTILVNLIDVPKGLATVTILDSLQRPCSERIFFAHYDKHSTISVTTDQSEYTTRQKVQVKLKLAPNSIDSIKGIVTVACVQSSRTEIKKVNDIESYYYLKNELETLPSKENFMGESLDDKDYLEKLLLIKGWRKYNWQEILENVNNSLNRPGKILFSGYVSHYGKPLKKPINLLIKTDSIANVIKTNSNGSFQLEGNNIFATEGRKIYLLLNNEKSDGYEIRMNNVFGNVTSRIIKSFKPINYNLSYSKEINGDSLTLPGLAHTINLREVKILDKKDKVYNEQQSLLSFAKGANECGDYVCINNILNCANHLFNSDNRPPEIGKTYRYGRGGTVVYHGCTIDPQGSSNISFNGVNYTKEFYGSDYSQFNPPGPEYQSTIYWKHLCFVSSKDTELSFYTSDITGPFDIIIQGISSNGLIYEKKEFNVKRK